MSKDNFSDEYKKYVDPNETFFQKVLRYLNHYKIPIICIVLLIAVIVVMSFTLRTKNDYDYQVLFLSNDTDLLDTPTGKDNNIIFKLEQFLNKSINEAYDGDDIKVNITFIYIGQDALYSDIVDNNKRQLVNSMSAGDALLIISDADGMEYLKTLERFFLDLNEIVPETEYDGIAYNLKNSSKAMKDLGLEDDLYYLCCNYENSWIRFSKADTLDKMMKISKDTLIYIKD